jgi:hypothetical protein
MKKGLFICVTGLCLLGLVGLGGVSAGAVADEPARPQGELRLTGTCIKRLTLARPGQPDVVLKSPGASVLLPEGQYRWTEVYLESGKGSGGFKASTYNYESWITIAPGRPATLEIGGPLKPEIQVNRRGSKLTLVHLLSDAVGNYYDAEGRSDRPRFTASQNGQTIGSGQFEYG